MPNCFASWPSSLVRFRQSWHAPYLIIAYRCRSPQHSRCGSFLCRTMNRALAKNRHGRPCFCTCFDCACCVDGQYVFAPCGTNGPHRSRCIHPKCDSHLWLLYGSSMNIPSFSRDFVPHWIMRLHSYVRFPRSDASTLGAILTAGIVRLKARPKQVSYAPPDRYAALPLTT